MKNNLIATLSLYSLALPLTAQNAMKTQQPNVILIYADDMGMGMLSCQGQKEFMTPNIDRLFRQGTQFNHAYACMVSAASRASLLTGYFDTKKEKIKINGGNLMLNPKDPQSDTPEEIDRILQPREAKINNNDVVLPIGDYYMAQVFQKAGYVTGQIGKLEYGWVATRQQLKRHGWDHYYGYLDHVACHGYYPPYLFEDGNVVMLEGNTRTNCGKTNEPETDKAYQQRWDMTGKNIYAQDAFDEKMKAFIRTNKDKPFFLYHPTLLPHGPVMIPEVHEYVKHNPHLSQIEKEYASMVIRLDSTVGMLMDEVEKQGIADRTLIIFASDNGHEIYYAQPGRVNKPWGRYDDCNNAYYSVAHGDVFNGNCSMRGFKRQNSDGAIRVPMAFYLPGVIPSATRLDDFVSICDLIPTFAEMTGITLSQSHKKDGISIWKCLTKNERLPRERHIMYTSYQGPAIVDGEGYKLRYNRISKKYYLHNVISDPQEKIDIAQEEPTRYEQLKQLLLEECRGDINRGNCGY